MTRSEARQAGLLLYHNGKPCTHGHSPAWRYTITGKCKACCVDERARYRPLRLARYAEKHPPDPLYHARAKAKAAGELTYDNGKPCRLGHLPIRYTTTGKCVACTKTESQRYKSQRAAYHRNARSIIIARVIAWKLANPDRTQQLRATYRAKHREALKAKSIIYRQTHPKDAILHRVRENLRRARRKNSKGVYTKADIQRLRNAQRNKCAYCRKCLDAGFSVDHIVPLMLSGDSDPRNLQLLCRSCNSSKGAKHPIDFANYLGLLL